MKQCGILVVSNKSGDPFFSEQISGMWYVGYLESFGRGYCMVMTQLMLWKSDDFAFMMRYIGNPKYDAVPCLCHETWYNQHTVYFA